MTPTIDDVIRRITEDLNEQIKSVVIQEKTIKVIIYKYLKALQLPPSQHLKDEPMDMKHHRSILLGWDKWAGGWDMSCDVYWYYRDWKFYITNIEHRVEDNEPLPEHTTTINTKELEALKIKARKYDELCK